MTTPLADKIKAIIRQTGPMSVADYFSLCLADPDHGYYRTHEPFGETGDFITAPEVSQLFGEMLGIFLIHAWQRHGMPADVRIVEIGPGRGTMMADIIRVIQKLSPALFDVASVHLVETSERLQKIQSQTLVENKWKITWHESFEAVPEGFLLLVANELFDALPIRQFVKTPDGFRERLVGLDAEDALAFVTGATGIDPQIFPVPPAAVPAGTIFEISPAREAVMSTICERLQAHKGTALIIDYGHMTTSFGDTLQAVQQHLFDPPLAHPGTSDLTSHVDFESLALQAKAAGISINGLMFQGDFLLGLGLIERASALGTSKDMLTQETIRLGVERLAGAGEGKMGELFKVLGVSHPAVGLMPFRTVAD
ncbi:class I SAM-dependent methyltransferase [Pararhizobium sp.]|uniref:class I SAM-dependent methyltransferase n=1 Tax=Pararhizobium sp. TaxID=1977563 RepID=UPI00271EE175|nr:class I SAM-dependent methyltransferase [Pararhizobium sp.]MDO9414786.1 class I SAM-dependent methyltransferase [Pararhizobium sp.]